jgi:citrate synthase
MVLKLNIDFALEEVTPKKLELLQAVFDAHDMAARNNQNSSSGAAVNAFFGSAQLTNAIASAILTLGDAHGPIGPARFVYEKFDERSLKSAILSGMKIPGFGNSFFKDSIDPAWSRVREIIEADFKKANDRINQLHSWMKEVGKYVHPNAALYSAVICNELGMIHGSESAIFVLARTAAWTSLCVKNER